VWVEKIQQKNWYPTKNSVICSKHFKETDFEPDFDDSIRKRLKRDAFPSLFDATRFSPEIYHHQSEGNHYIICLWNDLL